MEIISHAETFKLVDDELRFHCVKGVVRLNGLLYYAKWQDRFKLPTKSSELHGFEEIYTEDRGPLIKPAWTVTTPEQHHYIKTPDILSFCDGSDLEGLITREIETCELLRLHPHPNISPYFGCTELRGRVSGLCFKKHQQTLLEKLNPQGLNKAMFLDSEHRRLVVDHPLREAMDRFRGGIEHLHSLGIIHNDINPANIMLDKDGRLVLIDFDSCRRRGEPLGNTKRTHGWHDPKVMDATEQNDLDAFTELQTWLFGTSADSYLFP
ncbi:hypothetical protein diail_2027 [Diaporthe ilicicola]|nr:hypothetical protein diail_2027 [Diaporthe ilicicola]